MAIHLARAAHSRAQQSAGEKELLGDWRGESICQVRESACHDEDSLYHIAKIDSKSGWFSMKADKIVDGKPITLGTMECSYEGAKQSLTCEFPRGVFHFTVSGNKMNGTMNMPDGSVWRKLSFTKLPVQSGAK